MGRINFTTIEGLIAELLETTAAPRNLFDEFARGRASMTLEQYLQFCRERQVPQQRQQPPR